MTRGEDMELPWDERITVLSVHPDAASRDDVARLAAELMEARAEIQRLREMVRHMELPLGD